MSDFSTVQSAVDALARGEVIIVVDAEDRENEGDFICSAEKATPQSINFLLGGRGQFCTPLLPETARRLGLVPVVETNTAPLGTGFLTPIDHRSAKTGITAEERCRTVRAIADSATTANDFVRPGHVHPLLAKEGGVLRRAGHTEATVDLCRMAGLAPVGGPSDILRERRERATRDQLQAIAERHQLQITSIARLIAHRRVREKLVSRIAQARLPTGKFGDFTIIAYEVKFESHQ